MIEIMGQVLATGLVSAVLMVGLLAHVGGLMLKVSEKDGE